jgi:hypothetical protein
MVSAGLNNYLDHAPCSMHRVNTKSPGMTSFFPDCMRILMMTLQSFQAKSHLGAMAGDINRECSIVRIIRESVQNDVLKL